MCETGVASSSHSFKLTFNKLYGFLLQVYLAGDYSLALATCYCHHSL
ncbi:unnamed protein product [Amoebophrya sp. A25]|nr:unnamed protein product [Amoebophrya sp. A25]|eukprot:GSA25T00014516001.1